MNHTLQQYRHRLLALLVQLLLALLLLAVLAGCRPVLPAPDAPTPGDTPTVAASAAPLTPTIAETTEPDAPTATPEQPAPTATATATATATVPPATPTATPETEAAAVLPAPIYFLDDGQIMRLAADGLTLSQLTDEAAPVTGFDIAPELGRLVYVTNNDLIEIGLEGGARLVLVDGEPVAEDDFTGRFERQITDPRYAPNGQTIAFGRGGVNLIPSGGGDVTLIRPSSPYPEDGGAPSDEPIRFFWPEAWSPDGQKLLMEFAYYPEAGGLAIQDLTSGELVTVNNPEGITSGDWAWGNDGEVGFLASDILVYGAPGLVRVDASTGEGETLIRGLPEGSIGPDNQAALFQTPFDAPGGGLLALAEYASSFDALDGRFGWQMVGIGSDGENLTVATVREERFPASDALWAEDGSGAVLVLPQDFNQFPLEGLFRWVSTDGSPVLDLPGSGHTLRWGMPVEGEATAARPTAVELEALQSQFLASLALQEEGGIAGAAVQLLNTADGLRWLVHSVGMRSFDPPQPHTLAVYSFTPEGWEEEARFAFAEPESEGPLPPDYLGEGSARQVFIQPEDSGIYVEGGVGAHGGTAHVLLYDPDAGEITVAAAHSNAFPRVGRVDDVGGDVWQEVIFDQSDAYVFCYACGVRLVDYQLLRWNGSTLEAVTLTALPEGAPGAALNNEALNLAEAGLWAQAQEIIRQALAAAPAGAPASETIAWNAALINLIAEGRERAVSPYPLLGNVFYGEYSRAIDSLRGYAPAELFSASPPPVAGTVAEGSEGSLASALQTFTTRLLEAPVESSQAQRAAAHFLRGWALYLETQDPAQALPDVEQATSLVPNDTLYSNSATYLRQQ